MDAPAALCFLVAMFHSCNLRDIETVTPCICTGMGGAILVMLTVIDSMDGKAVARASMTRPATCSSSDDGVCMVRRMTSITSV